MNRRLRLPVALAFYSLTLGGAAAAGFYADGASTAAKQSPTAGHSPSHRYIVILCSAGDKDCGRNRQSASPTG